MIQKLKALCPYFCTGVLNSYSQVFFSDNKLFALILLIVSFFDVAAGIAGLTAVVITHLAAYLIGLNTQNIKAGFYGFNSLLVGLGIGVFYTPGVEFYVLLLFISLLTLFLTVSMEGIIGKYRLPYLSIPFLLSIWVVTLAARQFSSLEISEKGIFLMNEFYQMGELSAVNTYTWFSDINLPWSVRLYFRSLGAIFFQYNLLAGILIAAGLLIYSRIAFTLSLLGFFSAYLFYLFIGANVHELSTAYIGFNFILTAIAIGGFFLIPSWYSYLWVILLTPVISMLITSSMALLGLFQLSIFSLPFNLIVLLFLYTLSFRYRSLLKPEPVLFQQFSPEKNLYARQNYRERFGDPGVISLDLPFYGIWKVTQAHNGEVTHQLDWRHAWDFEVVNEEDTPYQGGGDRPEDFFAWNKPVLACADGIVAEVTNHVDDNPVREVNLKENWGNSVVIRHQDHLFSQVSHLKKGSVTVKPGDTVKRGEVIGHCGNSGRSPIPHLHFQLQQTPSTGSRTLDYPLGQYILHPGDPATSQPPLLKVFDKPMHHQRISNITGEGALTGAFHLVPGQMLTYHVVYDNGTEEELSWEVRTGFHNLTYLYCQATGAKAWFRTEGKIHYFTHFEGSQKSLLFFFFLGCWRVVTGFYQGMQITDRYPLSVLSDRRLIWIQDIVAPFFRFLHSEYTLSYVGHEDDFTHSSVELEATARICVGRHVNREIRFSIRAGRYGLERFVAEEGSRSITLTLKLPV